MLAAGSKLGPYEVAEPIGAGGMGEVYRARDSRVGRDVAIKVAAEQFGERFEREARAVAALNHPHICTLYDVGPNFLVMELVDGPTLAERIKEGPVSLDEALAIARQVADALEAAHERGIVHRDLKPANIKIKPDGTVKVLDFGLAKISDATPATTIDSPTFSALATQQGLILGTAGYMSPEQARGKPVDKRADIWAFGVILYEMLTGERLFSGDDVSEALAAVIKQEPDWNRVPAKVRRLLKLCLEKDPGKRLRDISGVGLLLEDAPEAPRRNAPWLAWSISAVCLLAAAAFAYLHLRTGLPEASEPMRFQIAPSVSLNWGGSFAISPDGRHLAFASADSDGREHLWLRSLDSLDARELPGTASPHIPPFFWSSDSRFIAYDAGGKLKKIDISGGTPQTLCDLSTNVIGGSWNRDGVIIFGNLFGGGGIRMVSAAGGTSSVLVKADPALGVSALYCPTFLSDGRHFLYFQNSSEAEHHGIYLGSIDSKPEGQASRQILPTGGAAVFVPAHDSSPGQILFLREQTLMAQPFDEKRMELAGEPLPVVDQVGSFSIWGFFSASTNGTLIFRGGSATQYSQVTLFDRQGKNLGNLGETDRLYGLAFAPNGARAAVTWNTDQVPSLDLWLIEFTRGIRTRLTFGEGSSYDPVWSQDGRSIAFSSNREGNLNIYRMPAVGGKEEGLYKSDYPVYPLSWSSDGRFLLFNEADPKSKADLWVLPLEGDRRPTPFLQTGFNEFDGRFSPNMQWVAYTSDVSGTNEIYLKRFSPDSGSSLETGGTTKVSQGGGAGPRWRGDGRELYYRSPDGKVMAVEVGAGTNFEPEPPRMLFQAPPAQNEAIQLIPLSIWDVASDGNRFLLSTPSAESSPTPFTVVLNWQAGLKK